MNRSPLGTLETDAVQLLDHLVRRAVIAGASDIHIEPKRDGLRVRYRIDGVMSGQGALPADVGPPLTTRVKVLAKMDMTERRLPQDGQLTLELGQGSPIHLAEPWIVANSLLAVVAQRLVRVLCGACAEPYALSVDIEGEDGQELVSAGRILKKAKGCATCHGTGYRGRTGIFEVLEVHDDVRDLVKSRAAARDYREAARKAGLVPLREAGIARALMGQTSLAEVMRVT
jgi:type II secretory ATPase GspE/PulE/Tfp pilus assembly ATPase PilB-like protein